jgi:hypothetical protein
VNATTSAATGTGAAPSTRPLPPPAPGFAELVGLHVRSLVREFPFAWGLFGLVMLWLPIASLLAPTPDLAAPAGPAAGSFDVAALVTLMLLNSSAAGFAVLVALLWPDAVWRNLPLGGREAMDSLPVSRRLHRSARYVAGAGLPLAMFASIAATQIILQRRGIEGVFAAAGFGERTPSLSLVLGAFGLLAAYGLGTALALRIGKVIFPLIVGFAAVWAVTFTAHLRGWTGLRDLLQNGLFLSDWAPVQAFFALVPSDAPAAAVLTWFAAFTALSVYLAGRYDRA